MTKPLRSTVGYLNAGGRGTRLNDLFIPDDKIGIAKAMLSVGCPEIRLVDHHIANFQQQGIEKVIVATGDQSQVFEYINDTYGVEDMVIATKSSEQLGTGGDLLEYARHDESTENIVVQNVDTILDIDLGSFLKIYNAQKRLGSIATIALTLNRGVPNEDAYAVSGLGSVQDSKEFNNDEYTNGNPLKYRASSTGAVAIEAEFLRNYCWQLTDGQLSLYKQILKGAWEAGGLFAYNNGTKFFRDIGTVTTWLASQGDIELQSYLRYNNTK